MVARRRNGVLIHRRPRKRAPHLRRARDAASPHSRIAANSHMSSHDANAAPESCPDDPQSTGWLSRASATPRSPLDGDGARSLEALWRALQASVRSRIQPGQYETWFRRAALLHADDGVVRIALQDKF